MTSYRWIPSGKFLPIPEHAVLAGRFYDKVPVYVGRFKHPSEGWISISLRVQENIYACYAYQGKEYSCDHFEVLVDPENQLQWTPATLDCPAKAIDLLENQAFRIGRLFGKPDTVYVGKIYKPNRCLYYPSDWKENATHHFDVLCIK